VKYVFPEASQVNAPPAAREHTRGEAFGVLRIASGVTKKIFKRLLLGGLSAVPIRDP
jgi:hypothetical protein